MKLHQCFINRIAKAAILLFSGALLSHTAAADPVALSSEELDSVSAGFVSLYGNATAHAIGEHVSVANINVDIAQQRTVDLEAGLGITVSTVTSSASALGDKVETSVAAGFDTNEAIVSLDVHHSTVSEVVLIPAPGPFHHYKPGGKSAEPGKGHRKGHQRGKFHRRRPGAGKYLYGKPVILQQESLSLTLVTVQPLN